MKIYQFAFAKIKKINEKVKSKLASRVTLSDQVNTVPATNANNISPAILEIVPTRQNTKIIGSNWLANFKNDEHSEHGEDGIITKIFVGNMQSWMKFLNPSK